MPRGFPKRPIARRFMYRIDGRDDPWDAADLLGELHGRDILARRPIFLRIEPDPEVPGGPLAFAGYLMDVRDDRISDPDGPCGLVQLSPTSWVFFGWYRSGAVLPEPPERLSLSELITLEGSEDDDAIETAAPEIGSPEDQADEPEG